MFVCEYISLICVKIVFSFEPV